MITLTKKQKQDIIDNWNVIDIKKFIFKNGTDLRLLELLFLYQRIKKLKIDNRIFVDNLFDSLFFKGAFLRCYKEQGNNLKWKDVIDTMIELRDFVTRENRVFKRRIK